GANSPETIRAAVFDSFAAIPHPAPLGDDMLNRIADKLVIHLAHTTPSAVHAQHAQTRPSAVHAQSRTDAQPEQGRTASHAQPEQPVTTVHAQSEQPRTDAQQETVHAQPELTAAARQVEADLYPEWIGQVSAKAITAGARDAKRFISQATFTHGDKTVLAVQEMGRIWLNWQDRAANDGVLKPNPKYQPGNRQPKYLLAA
ncbi:hypothetical protein VSS37_00040, partial [Candidatus Thiothrix sp. Deng01]|nr:hypothetical protein [Candidatus Thiothrix sp. Deng01]